MKTLLIIFFFISCVISQKSVNNNFDSSDISSVDFSGGKILLTESGTKKLSLIESNDTIIVMGIKFWVADIHISYFPLSPIIMKSNETNTLCYYKIDHLNSNEQEHILKIFESKK